MHKNARGLKPSHDSNTDVESLPLAFLVDDVEAHGHTSLSTDICWSLLKNDNFKYQFKTHIHIRKYYLYLNYIHLSKL